MFIFNVEVIVHIFKITHMKSHTLNFDRIQYLEKNSYVIFEMLCLGNNISSCF